jgi:hypothetical protein
VGGEMSIKKLNQENNPSEETVESVILNYTFNQPDPVARFLTDKLHFTPRSFSFFMLGLGILMMALPTLIIAIMHDTYGYNGWYEYLLFLLRTSFLFTGLLLPPLIGGYYLWMSTVPHSLIHDVLQTGVLKLSTIQNIETKNRLEKIYSKNWSILAIIATFLLCFLYYYVMVYINSDSKNFIKLPVFTSDFFTAISDKIDISDLSGQLDIGAFTVIPWLIFGVYAIIMIFIRGCQNIIGLSLLFKNSDADIEPLHPDKCGGLNVINRYVLRLSYLIAGCGLGLGLFNLATSQLQSYKFGYFVYSMIALYIFIAPSFFFFSLGSAHKAMKTSKDHYLDIISKKYQVKYKYITTKIENYSTRQNLSKFKLQLEELEQLDIIYKRTDAFPVWPLDWGSLFRFSRAIAISLTPTIISIAIHPFWETIPKP